MNTVICKNAFLFFFVFTLTNMVSIPLFAATSDCTYEYEGNLSQGVRISIQDDSKGSITRTFSYYVPKTAYPAAAYNQLPLVFVLHGRGASADTIFGTADYYDWGYPWCRMMKEADEDRFIICAPDGWENSSGEQAWNDCREEDPYSPGTNDVLFIKELIQWFIANGYNINPNKIFAAGFSSGAGMVFRLAIELGDQVAAVAAVGSLFPRPSLSECGPPVEKVGIFIMNGTSDPRVPFEHAESAVDYWLLYNNLPLNGEFIRLPDNVAFPEEPQTNLWTVLDRYTAEPGNPEGTEVRLYTVNNGGHCEPSIVEHYPDYYKYDLGAGFQCHDFEIAEEVWEFFRSQWLAEERTYRPTSTRVIYGSGTGMTADVWLDEPGDNTGYVIDDADGVTMFESTFSLLEGGEVESLRISVVSRTTMAVPRSVHLWNNTSGSWYEIVTDTGSTGEKLLERVRTVNAPAFVSSNGQVKVAIQTDDSVDKEPHQLIVDLVEIGVVYGDAYQLPVAIDDQYDVLENTVLSVDDSSILDNDLPAGGTALLVDDVQSGMLHLFSDGTFTYEPDLNFTGNDSFTYQADDGVGKSNSATVTIEVIGTNDAPVAYNDTAVTGKDIAVSIDVLANDTDDDGDALTVGNITSPAHGVVAVNPDGMVTYTPHAGYVGPDTFTYRANDGTVNSNNALVTVTISEGLPSEPPAAQGDYAVTTKNNSVTIAILANDSDPDSTIDPTTVVLVASPNRGGVVAVNGDGTVTYTPQYNFWGTELFSYAVADTEGNLSNEAPVTVTVQFPPKGNLWWLWLLLLSN